MHTWITNWPGRSKKKKFSPFFTIIISFLFVSYLTLKNRSNVHSYQGYSNEEKRVHAKHRSPTHWYSLICKRRKVVRHSTSQTVCHYHDGRTIIISNRVLWFQLNLNGSKRSIWWKDFRDVSAMKSTTTPLLINWKMERKMEKSRRHLEIDKSFVNANV